MKTATRSCSTAISRKSRCRSRSAMRSPGYEHMMAYLDEYSFRPKLHRWRFNLATGTTREERLDDRVMEFGMINQRFAGRKYRYAFSTLSEPGWFLFNGFVRNDLRDGRDAGTSRSAPAVLPARRPSRRASARRGRRRLSGELRHRRKHGHVGMHPARCRPYRRRTGLPHRAAAQAVQRHAFLLGGSGCQLSWILYVFQPDIGRFAAPEIAGPAAIPFHFDLATSLNDGAGVLAVRPRNAPPCRPIGR